MTLVYVEQLAPDTRTLTCSTDAYTSNVFPKRGAEIGPLATTMFLAVIIPIPN